MKNNIVIFLYLLCAWLCMGSSCKKKEMSDQAPKNYFTCKINGVEYKPSGYDGTPNYYIHIDTSYRDGTISVNTYNSSNNNLNYSFGFGSDSVKNVGKFYLKRAGRHRMDYTSYNLNCQYFSDDSDVEILSGSFTFDTYDLENFIFSGQFEALMAKTDGCDTLRITEGKFYYHQ